MTEDDKQRARRRATAILIRKDRVLLLREPQDTEFHLPGGGVEQGELPITGVARELYEETGLAATRIEYLFSYYEDWGEDGIHFSGQDHSVFRVEADGEIRLSPEIQEYTWWDRATDLQLFEWVKPMLSRCDGVSQ